MNIGDLLDRGAIAPRVTAPGKRQALCVVAEMAARSFRLKPAEVLDALRDDETLLVVSTDLSHYYDAIAAQQLDEATARAVEALDAMAKEKGASIPQLALAWLLAQPAVSSVIIGANKMAQLEDNLKAADTQLAAAEVERLSLTTQPPTLYPQWMVERQNSRRQ